MNTKDLIATFIIYFLLDEGKISTYFTIWDEGKINIFTMGVFVLIVLFGGGGALRPGR